MRKKHGGPHSGLTGGLVVHSLLENTKLTERAEHFESGTEVTRKTWAENPFVPTSADDKGNDPPI